jgi:hypothetical protein
MKRKVILTSCICVLIIGALALFLLFQWGKTPAETEKRPVNNLVQTVSSSKETSAAYKLLENKPQLTQKEKLEDFDYMYKILKENYPFFEVNKRLNNIDWLAKKDEYIGRIKDTSNDYSFLMQLNIILEDIHNGHTNIIDRDSYLDLLLAYQDTEKVDDSFKPWCTVLQNKKELARYEIDENYIKQDYQDVQVNDNFIISDNVKTEMLIKDKIAYLGIKSLSNKDGDSKIITPFLKEIKDCKALIIDIRGNDGGDSSYWSENIIPMLTKKDLSCNWYHLYRGGNYSEPFVYSRTGYKFQDMKPISDLLDEKLKACPPEVKSDFKYYNKSRKVVKSKNYVGFKGQVYLLVDRYVYSSAEMFAAFCKGTGFATLVGETTGGDGIGSDPLICALPNSGYILRFPAIMGLNSEGACDEEYKTQPDIQISAQKNDNLLSDNAVNYVIKLVK